MSRIKDTIGEAAVLENLAEEAAELAQAALKLARVIRGENPTPVSMAAARGHLVEEITDVHVCINVLGLGYDPQILYTKVRRWLDRIDESKIGSNVETFTEDTAKRYREKLADACAVLKAMLDDSEGVKTDSEMLETALRVHNF